VDGVVIPNGARDSDFGVLYDGYIKIPERGIYTFFANSDDGSALLVDGKVIVNNDGRHAPIEKSGFTLLEGGYHRFQVMFYQAGGGMELSASIKGPGMEKQVIPSGLLFHEK